MHIYVSVHHDFIRVSLEHYQAPARMVAAVINLYQGLIGIVKIKERATAPFSLFAIIFNTMMNTQVDSITQSHHHLGYSLSTSNHRCNLLQYADNTSLLANGPAASQTLLECTERWYTGQRGSPRSLSAVVWQLKPTLGRPMTHSSPSVV